MHLLEMPAVRPRLHIERDDRPGEQIVSAPMSFIGEIRVPIGRPILPQPDVTGGEIDHAEIRIERGAVQDAAPAVLVRVPLPRVREAVAWTGDRVELPDLFAGLGVVRAHLPASAAVAPGRADVHQTVVIDGRRRRIRAGLAGQPRLPHEGAGLLVERDEHGIAAGEEHFPVRDHDSLISAGRPFRVRAVSPFHLPGGGVDGERVPGAGRDIHHAIDDDRRSFELAARATVLQADHPRAAQLLDIGGVDLVERGVALMPVVPSAQRKVLARRRNPVPAGDHGGRDDGGNREADHGRQTS